MTGVLLFTTGLILFLFGMIKLGTSIQQLFSARFRSYIKFSVEKRYHGIISGVVTTILFQSSSATTLLTISLVSAGLIGFYDSLSVVLGADLGTTITAQLVVWNVTAISPIVLFIGGILFLAGNDKWKPFGEALFYFGLIFFGLLLTGQATAPLKANPAFLGFFQHARNPLFGVGIGIVFTGIVQASAIPVSILIIMGQQGLVTIDNALPIVLGANIGTTITALLGSIATDINGKRSAVAHLVFKTVGVFVCLVGLPLFLMLLKWISESAAQQIALGHMIFNMFLIVLFAPFIKPFAAMIKKMMPGDENVLPLWPEHLNEDCLRAPEMALGCVHRELQREILLVRKMLEDSLLLVFEFSEVKCKSIAYMEIVVDNLQMEITKYLWNISCGQLTPWLSKRLFSFSTIVYEIERIGDRSTNLMELAESKFTRKAVFSPAAEDELRQIGGLVCGNVDDTSKILEKRDIAVIQRIFNTKPRIDVAIDEAVNRHLERFYKRVCMAEAGPIFVDMLVNLERISGHCSAIADCLRDMDEKEG